MPFRMAVTKYNLISIVTTLVVWSFLAVNAAPPLQNSVRMKISPNLESRLEENRRADIIIRMSSGSSQVVQKVSRKRFISRNLRLESLHNALKTHAEKTQRKILQFFPSRSTSFSQQVQSFWVTNQIFVKNADLRLIQSLLEAFPNEIESIYEDQIVASIPSPVEVKAVSPPEIELELQWGLEKIQAPEAWRELGFSNRAGIKSANHSTEIRIATIDTGVRATHTVLKDNFLGDYGWYDPTFGELTPADRMGHGTHLTAIIAGGGGIGVAPWVKWMACRACPTMGCTMSNLLACGQFMLCPTLADGSSPDCSKAPHVVSNSWSAGQGNTWFNEVIEAWHAAGIIPIFSIGNFGNAFCGTANSPGDQESVIAVSSITMEDTLSWFASIGPTVNGGPDLIKPDVVAPGSDILSASHDNDNAYKLMSGTSQACPHVSGVVALLLTYNPDLTYEEIKTALLATTEQNLQPINKNCSGIPETEYPNHAFGYGRVNALKSLLYVSSLSK